MPEHQSVSTVTTCVWRSWSVADHGLSCCQAADGIQGCPCMTRASEKWMPCSLPWSVDRTSVDSAQVSRAEVVSGGNVS